MRPLDPPSDQLQVHRAVEPGDPQRERQIGPEGDRLARPGGPFARVSRKAAANPVAAFILSWAKGARGLRQTVPFGPYLALGLWITWLYGPVNLQWI